jgi:hypothetical protein
MDSQLTNSRFAVTCAETINFNRQIMKTRECIPEEDVEMMLEGKENKDYWL